MKKNAAIILFAVVSLWSPLHVAADSVVWVLGQRIDPFVISTSVDPTEGALDAAIAEIIDYEGGVLSLGSVGIQGLSTEMTDQDCEREMSVMAGSCIVTVSAIGTACVYYGGRLTTSAMGQLDNLSRLQKVLGSSSVFAGQVLSCENIAELGNQLCADFALEALNACKANN